jgi:hypothetical protein
MTQLSRSTRIQAALGAIIIPAVLVSLILPDSAYASYVSDIVYGATVTFLFGGGSLLAGVMAYAAIKGKF